MTKLTLILLFNICTYAVNSQPLKTDSLKHLLDTEPQQDSLRVVRLSLYVYSLLFSNPQKMEPYAAEARAIAEKLKKPDALSRAYQVNGLVQQYVFNNAGSAIEFYEKALDANPGNASSAFTNTSNIAILFYNQKQYRKSLAYFEKATILLGQMDNKRAEAQLLCNRANVYFDLQRKDSAKMLFKQSLMLANAQGNALVSATANNSLGYMALKDNKFAEAENYCQTALALAQKMNNLLIQANSHVNLALIKLGLNQTDSAEHYGLEGLHTAEKVQSMQFRRQAWEALADVYEKQGRWQQAFTAAKNYSMLNDTLLSDESKQEVTRLDMAYTQERKEALLHAQHAAEIKQQRITRNFVMAGAGFALFSGLLLFFSYKRRRDADNKRMNAEFKAHIADTEMKVMRLQMNPHFIFNSLNSISDYIVKNNPHEADAYLSKFAKLMRLTLENSEQQAISLADDLKSLELYIQLEAKRLPNKFTYEINVAADIDTETTLVPPMIFQPFVENSIWHGVAKKDGKGHIGINIRKENEMLFCVVDDNGIGRQWAMNQRGQMEKQSLGMKITKARIDILNKLKGTNASVQLLDKPQGLTAHVKLPLETAF